ncbi:4-hydroxy-3-methylbut-2-enyl diphosphate reductase [Chelatococcus sp. GCM10030263]|uniref:4-hydroxy-3-methylbut-2-enyl diphosphate reductase n=1 Tax=Chelatococcus sp. GCM10030263 TaxID=3273387 RepID=UPI003612E2DF
MPLAPTPAAKPPLTVLICAPRGFCAGVVRAIDAVEKALTVYGPPVYVRHEIVHNKYVVESLKRKGAVFVDELDEVPDTTAPVIFSAHGVPKAVPNEAERRRLFGIDATCPLVTKVHREAEVHHKRGRHIVLIGHAGHPEVVGTMGQLPSGAISLVETIADVERLVPPPADNLAYVTQTTLSVDDTEAIVAALKRRFPAIASPHKEDICYATTNRQEAVKRVAPQVDAMIVVGSPNSSNSQRLKEVAERAGCHIARLVLRAEEIDWTVFSGIRSLGLTAGASAPEILVEEIIDAFAERFEVTVETVSTADESVFFPLPRALREEAAE